jgi:hypothetical protein
MVARHNRDLCLTLLVVYLKHRNLWAHPNTVWGKLHSRAAWYLIWNLVQSFRFSAHSELNAALN